MFRYADEKEGGGGGWRGEDRETKITSPGVVVNVGGRRGWLLGGVLLLLRRFKQLGRLLLLHHGDNRSLGLGRMSAGIG